MGGFEKNLGLSSLECTKAILILQQMVLPIFNGGVRLISSEVIVLTTYLGRP
jgi:hypothetical protein